MNNEQLKAIDNHWSKQYQQQKMRTRWWDSPHIIRHINKNICGEELDGWNSGPIKLLKQVLPEGYVLESALSIGCGIGSKEMNLLEQNLVKHFTCFELSTIAIEKARQKAQEKGLSERITFVHGDFFHSPERQAKYDMVFWDNSLHHMPDATEAVRVSYEVLNDGGIFFCNDFVGKSKFQWSDMELAIVNGVRVLLPDSIFEYNSKTLARSVYKMSIDQMDAIDPSEAADSASIIPAIQNTFAEPFIVPTGGLIYHLCLNDILINIPENSALLDYLLKLDDETIQMGMLHYAFALAIK